MSNTTDIINILQTYALELGCTEYLYKPDVQRKAVEAIHRTQLESRIDELESNRNLTGYSVGNITLLSDEVEDRIKALKAALEKQA